MFFYSDNEKKQPFTGKPIPYHEMPAVEYWTKHYENSLYLVFYEKNDPDIRMRRQAAKELEICQKKMDYWKKHPNWNATEAGQRAEELKKKWA